MYEYTHFRMIIQIGARLHLVKLFHFRFNRQRKIFMKQTSDDLVTFALPQIKHNDFFFLVENQVVITYIFSGWPLDLIQVVFITIYGGGNVDFCILQIMIVQRHKWFSKKSISNYLGK